MQNSLVHKPISPMLLESTDKPPTGPYLHQLKFDGHRCILSYNGSNVRLFTRHRNECTRQYPELQLTFPVKNLVLDGEMIALDENGKPCFDAVMTRFNCSKENTIQSYLKSIPAHFVAFDLLWINDEDFTQKPIEERLSALESIIQPSNAISVCPTYENGESLFHSVSQLGLEGTVSKRFGSKIKLATRSRNWLKAKVWSYETVAISAIRKGKFGWALSKNGQYVGVTEFVPPQVRKKLYSLANQLKTHEDDNWIYLQPLIQGKVKFQCYSKKGLLRSASLQELVGI